MDNIIKVNNLTKTYDNFKLDNITLEIKKGSIIGLIGENGAGKTTLIKLLLGLIKKDKGDILIFNKTLNNKVKEDIGVVLDDSFFPEVIKVKDVNSIMKNIYKSWDEKLFFKYLKDFSLNENMLIKNLSKGMKKKLEIITALAHHPKLLILDEPFTGLDPINVELMKKAIYKLQKEGCSIIFSSHQMEHIENFCEKLIILVKGKPIVDGYVKDIKKEYKKKNILIRGEELPLKEIEKIKGVLSITNEKGEYLVKIEDESVAKKVFSKIKNCNITKYDVTEPTLNEIFIAKVGGVHE